MGHFMFNKSAVFIVAAMVLSVAGAARAQDCGPLKQMASLAITTLPDGNIAIPASVEGHDGLFVVTMDDSHTKVSGEILDQLRVGPRMLPFGSAIEGSDAILTVPNFKIANLDIKATPVLWLNDKPKQAGVIGSIGTDLLGMFDLELDIAHAKLNLFSPDHCPGHVVYWTNGVAAAIPFTFDTTGNITFDAAIDGKPLQVQFSTRPGHSTVRPDVAQSVLGYQMPPANPLAKGEVPNPAPTPVPGNFKTLTIGGITISNPKIDITGVTIEGLKCDGKPHSFHGIFVSCMKDSGFRLGLAELSALHMYFAVHEKMLYVTPASAVR
jgi:hypothetical protein